LVEQRLRILQVGGRRIVGQIAARLSEGPGRLHYSLETVYETTIAGVKMEIPV